MSNNSKKDLLRPNTSDHVASILKATLGTVPVVGSLLTELIGTVIPNQREDRLAKFAQALEHRLSNLEEKCIQAQTSNEQFIDLLEEGLRQAARSLTDERRDYIAAVIANSLSTENVKYIDSKHLLRMLGEINDIEVIWLRFYLHPSMDGDQEFRARHQNVLQPVATNMGSSREELDNETLQRSYKEHLTQLGLLEYRYKLHPKTKTPQYNSSTGAPEVSGYAITSTGRLLLRHIGFEL